MNGFLLVDKPLGLSSFGAIKRLNKQFSIQRRFKKIGHGGTLDPYASGLLVIAIGKATRLLRFFLGSDKRYEARVCLGTRTSTDDIEGEVVQTAPFNHVTREAIESVLPQFRGDISQVPPAFSALHVDGKRAYALARRGETVDLPARNVIVHRLELGACGLPNDPEFSLDVTCSGGTYIRSLARDLGWALQTQAHLLGLRRTQACHFDVQSAHTLEFLCQQDDIAPFVLPCTQAMAHLPALEPKKSTIERFLNGLPVQFHLSQDGIYRVMYRDELIAVIERKDNHEDYLRLFANHEFCDLTTQTP